GAFVLTRSRVDGSVYLSDGFMFRSVAFDTQIDGSWHQVNSITLKEADFHGLKVSTDFDLSSSALTKLLITSSQIKGGLYLTGSEARCAYQIKANDIRSAAMEKTGFGSLVSLDGAAVSDETKRPVIYAWWKRLLSPVQDAGQDGRSQKVRAGLGEAEQPECKRSGASRDPPCCRSRVEGCSPGLR